MLTLLALIVVLGVLVFVHELGHFLAAKWAGIYVHRFSLGLGPPIPWLTYKRGETEYSISWLPLGGYVKMASREEEATSAALEGGASATPVPPDRVFEAKPLWKRMIVILAGVTMNLIFAWVVYVGLALKNGRTVEPVTIIGRVDSTMIVPGLEPLRELRPGDRIVAVGGTPVHYWAEIPSELLNSPRDTVTITLADGRRVAFAVHPSALEERQRLAQALDAFRPAVVADVLPGKPGHAAGIQPGDTLLAVDGRPTPQWLDAVDVIQSHPGQPITLELGTAKGRRTVSVVPYADTLREKGKPVQIVGRVGISGPRPKVESEPYSLLGAIEAGTDATVGTVVLTLRTVQGLINRQVSSKNLGGPILIAQQAGQAARLGLDVFLGFMALVSVNLAVLNLLPIPVLDGGQLLFLIAEAVLRRPLNLKVRERLTAVGLVLVLLLMVFAFSNDIRRLLGLL